MIKFSFGSALAKEVSSREMIDLKKIDPAARGAISRRFIAEIIEMRLAEILEFVDNELKRIGRSGKLPAGVVLVGAGALRPNYFPRTSPLAPVSTGFRANRATPRILPAMEAAYHNRSAQCPRSRLSSHEGLGVYLLRHGRARGKPLRATPCAAFPAPSQKADN